MFPSGVPAISRCLSASNSTATICPHKSSYSVTFSHTIENILESCEVELENIDGMMKFRRDISSKRLFCKGVPVSSRRCSACGERDMETS